MKSAVLLPLCVLMSLAAVPARAQFAGSNGLASSPSAGPNISGAGTGLSAPAAAPSPGIATGSPNAMPGPIATPPIYPGVGIGSTGLPPPPVTPPPAALARQRAQQQQQRPR